MTCSDSAHPINNSWVRLNLLANEPMNFFVCIYSWCPVIADWRLAMNFGVGTLATSGKRESKLNAALPLFTTFLASACLHLHTQISHKVNSTAQPGAQRDTAHRADLVWQYWLRALPVSSLLAKKGMPSDGVFRVLQPPASQDDVSQLLDACGGVLPSTYLNFLVQSNGAECCVHDQDGDCLALWSAAEIPELNEAYAVSRWCPELLIIGSDGGDDAVGFDRATSTDPEQWPIVRIGFGNLDRQDFVQVAPSFAAWRLLEFRIRALG